MPVSISTLGYVEQLASFQQNEIKDSLKDLLKLEKKDSKRFEAFFENSSIDNRHSVFNELLKIDSHLPNLKTLAKASTTKRNNLYREIAPKLFTDASQNIIKKNESITTTDITHVITASCTGCYSPGPGVEIIQSLGLNEKTERLHIGFMGCYAGLAAIRIANSICQSDPNAVVLIACVEISSLHWHLDNSIDNLLSLSLFGDGAAAALVSAKPLSGSFIINSCASSLVPNTKEEMSWNMGDFGFDMQLSRKIPSIIESSIASAIDSFVQNNRKAIDTWAIHPGGTKIIQSVEKTLELNKSSTASTWETLKNHGNMSSCTIFFVLEQIKKESPKKENICGLAFGPGLTMEMIHLTSK